MINRGGEKIWCTDVEDELIAQDGVKDAAVVGIPNEKYGEVAAAVVVLETGYELTEEELKARLKNRLARFKIPEKIFICRSGSEDAGIKNR